MAQLTDMLAEAQGGPIDFDGRRVQMAYFRPVVGGQRFRVLRNAARLNPVMGTRLQLDSGKLRIGKSSSSLLVLFEDTTPEPVTVEVVAKRPTRLTVANCWRTPEGRADCWLGNAGLMVEEGPDGVILKCSYGGNPVPQFDDLVIELRFDE